MGLLAPRKKLPMIRLMGLVTISAHLVNIAACSDPAKWFLTGLVHLYNIRQVAQQRTRF